MNRALSNFIKDFQRLFNNLAFVTVLWGVGVFITIFLCKFWDNELRQAVEHTNTERIFQSKLFPNTFWVKEKFPVYFILQKGLCSIHLDGTDMQYIFEADEPLREYQFSPDGTMLLVLTNTELYKLDMAAHRLSNSPPHEGEGILSDNLDRAQKSSQLIESLKGLKEKDVVTSLIHRVRWSPDNQKILYQISRWSRYSTQDSLYVFDLKEQKKFRIRTLPYKIMDLFWDQNGENIYYARYRTLSEISPEYEVRLFKVPLKTLEPEQIKKIQTREPSIRGVDFGLLSVKPFFKNEDLIFGRGSRDMPVAISERKEKVGFNEKDYLYYEKANGKRKVFFKIPRGKRSAVFSIRDVRWVPSEEYVTMKHDTLGILVFDPRMGRLGHLISAEALGWYENKIKN